MYPGLGHDFASTERQYALLEFIAHVNTEDLDAIPKDFVNLGFTPPDKLERVANSGNHGRPQFHATTTLRWWRCQGHAATRKKELQDRYGTEDKDEIRKTS